MMTDDLLNALRWSCSLFLPGPKILWASLSLAVFFVDSVYLQYFALGYYHEVFINHLVKHAEFGDICGQRVLPAFGGSCIETQLFTSFFAFIVVHLIFHGKHGIPKFKSVICAVCFIALVLSLFTMGTCNLLSIGVGAVIGIVNGILRALLYRAAFREPVRHILCSPNGSLIKCVTLYIHQSKLYGPSVFDSHCEFCHRVGCDGECMNDEDPGVV